jgi:hypothetical protein
MSATHWFLEKIAGKVVLTPQSVQISNIPAPYHAVVVQMYGCDHNLLRRNK